MTSPPQSRGVEQTLRDYQRRLDILERQALKQRVSIPLPAAAAAGIGSALVARSSGSVVLPTGSNNQIDLVSTMHNTTTGLVVGSNGVVVSETAIYLMVAHFEFSTSFAASKTGTIIFAPFVSPALNGVINGSDAGNTRFVTVTFVTEVPNPELVSIQCQQDSGSDRTIVVAQLTMIPFG